MSQFWKQWKRDYILGEDGKYWGNFDCLLDGRQPYEQEVEKKYNRKWVKVKHYWSIFQNHLTNDINYILVYCNRSQWIKNRRPKQENVLEKFKNQKKKKREFVAERRTRNHDYHIVWISKVPLLVLYHYYH